MKKFIALAVRATVHLPIDREHHHPLEELAARMRREMEQGRDVDVASMLLPGVTVEMAAFYREFPDGN